MGSAMLGGSAPESYATIPRRRSPARLIRAGDPLVESAIDRDLSIVTGQFLTDFLLFTVGYTVRDVIYRWKHVDIAEDMKLSQFDLIGTPSANQTDQLKSGDDRQ
ncbi:unnamed protein product [Nesidiocoris tenuis]|uniref:Uncharacterized protein n=1 Tax=Nesidiocoris tenuis TaxID=355587 RepID=A0A6H5GBS5_9HEMI|nr:unnamed protein product [Nesidiocoris tenuis]CAA9999559.1 unnamed protein product [Nesidiocoris tenuis]